MKVTCCHLFLLNGAIVALLAQRQLLADAPTSQTAPAPAPLPLPLPPITPVRYTEDYSAAPPSLKHVPLGDGGDSYLSLGIEFRLRYELYLDNLWGQGPQDSDGYLWERTMPYADLHIGPNFRAFGQLVSAFEWGDATGIKPPDEDRLDVLQAFVDVRVPIGEDQSLLVRPGRQILRYGSERLIGMRYGANVPLPFDAALARFETALCRIDAFYGHPIKTERGEWDDQSDDTQALWSLYTTLALPSIGKRTGIDAYYIGYSDDQARFAQGPGEELRHTLGVRFFGEKSDFDWDLEGSYQFGRYDTSNGDGRISAWAVGSNIGYTFDGAALRPRLGMKANVISGDDNPRDADLQTFNSLFPKRKYFGEMGLIGPYNLIDVHPSLTLQLTNKTAFELASVFYWRYSTNDGIYNTPGNVIRTGFDTDARFIGTQLEAVLTHRFSREFEVTAAYEVFLPGRFIEDTGRDEVVHFVAIELLYRL